MSWVHAIQPQIGDDRSLDDLLVTIWYTVADVLLIAVLARMMLGAHCRTVADRLLLAGLLAQLAADFWYAGAAVGADVGGWVDVGWLAFYACWGAAALVPAAPVVRVPARPTRAARIAFAVAAFVTPVLLSSRSSGTGTTATSRSRSAWRSPSPSPACASG